MLGVGRRAERAGADGRPIAVLLLPAPLEVFPLRDRAEDLLTAPGVVAVDPARASGALGRLPESVLAGLAAGQARRMRLPGVPRVVVLFDPLQYPLARSLVAENPDAELWYAEWAGGADLPPRRRRRLEELDSMAALRADLRFDATPEDAPARERNLPLWERLERLGVESGRLGSERADVIRAWRGPGAA
jgi:hypothetical protein